MIWPGFWGRLTILGKASGRLGRTRCGSYRGAECCATQHFVCIIFGTLVARPTLASCARLPRRGRLDHLDGLAEAGAFHGLAEVGAAEIDYAAHFVEA